MFKFWKALPEWAQWVLYLPCVLISSAGAGLLVSLPMLIGLVFWGKPSKVSVVIFSSLSAFVATTVFYWAAFYLAPRGKKIAGGILYVVMMLLWVLTFIRITYEWSQGISTLEYKSIAELSQSLIGISWGSFLFISAFRNNDEKQL